MNVLKRSSVVFYANEEMEKFMRNGDPFAFHFRGEERTIVS